MSEGWRAREIDVDAIAAGRHDDPFGTLGPHLTPEGWAIRVFAPDSIAVSAVACDGATITALGRRRGDFFEGLVGGAARQPRYRLRIERAAGVETVEDAYAFPPILGEIDDYLAAEGAHLEIYKRFGAQPTRHMGVDGVLFAVWAPNARRVAVVGDFNRWDGRRNPMRKRVGSGLWELFVPGLGVGAACENDMEGVWVHPSGVDQASDRLAKSIDPPFEVDVPEVQEHTARLLRRRRRRRNPVIKPVGQGGEP